MTFLNKSYRFLHRYMTDVVCKNLHTWWTSWELVMSCSLSDLIYFTQKPIIKVWYNADFRSKAFHWVVFWMLLTQVLQLQLLQNEEHRNIKQDSSIGETKQKKSNESSLLIYKFQICTKHKTNGASDDTWSLFSVKSTKYNMTER